MDSRSSVSIAGGLRIFYLFLLWSEPYQIKRGGNPTRGKDFGVVANVLASKKIKTYSCTLFFFFWWITFLGHKLGRCSLAFLYFFYLYFCLVMLPQPS